MLPANALPLRFSICRFVRCANAHRIFLVFIVSEKSMRGADGSVATVLFKIESRYKRDLSYCPVLPRRAWLSKPLASSAMLRAAPRPSGSVHEKWTLAGDSSACPPRPLNGHRGRH